MRQRLNSALLVPGINTMPPYRTFRVFRPRGMEDVLIAAHMVDTTDCGALALLETVQEGEVLDPETKQRMPVLRQYVRRIFAPGFWTDVEEVIQTSKAVN